MEENARRENARWLIAAALIHSPWAHEFRDGLVETYEFVRLLEEERATRCDEVKRAVETLMEYAEAYNKRGPLSPEGRQFLVAALCALERADQLPDGIAASLLRFLVTGRFPT
jgi:hypothetical protein